MPTIKTNSYTSTNPKYSNRLLQHKRTISPNKLTDQIKHNLAR